MLTSIYDTIFINEDEFDDDEFGEEGFYLF